MPNNYFHFKQFTIQQEKCAMKVCTDACLFGAWAGDYLHNKFANNILDIGTGTGLLSLMLAQKTSAAIDTVEIDKEAYEQALENVQQSAYEKSIKVFLTSINDFKPDYKYSFIVSNPPFFEADLKSAQQNKNAAKHDTTLTLDVLCQKVKQLMNKEGYFAVLLPYHRTNYFITESLKNDLHCIEMVLIKQTPKHDYFRSMLLFSFSKTKITEKEIIIKDTDGNYTKAFTALLKDYYLYL
jgi:tRNA1Val (adenine37-N6)-methyltransferase